MSSATSLHYLIMFGTAPLTSVLVNKYGCRAVSTASGFLMTTSLCISTYMPTAASYTAIYGLVYGLGCSFEFCSACILVAFYFEKVHIYKISSWTPNGIEKSIYYHFQRRSLATGIAQSGSGIGIAVLSPVNAVLIEYFGWQTTRTIMASLSFLVWYDKCHLHSDDL